MTITAVPGGRAASAVVQPDGTLRTSVAAPRAAGASRVRYRASIERRRSSTLQLVRRLLTSAAPGSRGTRVTLRVTGRRQAGFA